MECRCNPVYFKWNNIKSLQQTPQRDYAVHMVRTPPQEEEEDEVNLENESEFEPQKPQRTLQTTTDVWVITHAKQVFITQIWKKASTLCWRTEYGALVRLTADEVTAY